MGRHNKVYVRRIAATLRSGKKILIPAWVVDSRTEGPRLLLVAAQHGNEVQGAESIRRFVEFVARRPMRGCVFAVPLANLPAVRWRRPHLGLGPEQPYDDDRGHNMNRTWPGKKDGNDTARVSYAIYRAFGERATHALDLHCWEPHNAPGLIIHGAPASRAIARRMGCRFVYVGPSSRGMLADHFCLTGRLGMTYEYTGQYTVTEDQVREGLRVITNFAKLIGLMDGAPEPGQHPILFSDKTDSITVRAPRSGLYVARPLPLCSRVKKGTVLGHLLSDRDLSCEEIRSPVTAYLRGQGIRRPDCDVSLAQQHPYVEKGDGLARLVWLRK